MWRCTSCRWAGRIQRDCRQGAIFFLATRRIATPADANLIYLLGVGTFLLCILLLMLGRRIERTLELLNWVMVVCILGGFLLLGLYFVPGSTWAAAAVGFFGFDLPRRTFSLCRVTRTTC
jgi:MFS-type transporter involved in bile tolerance (Atg22 family)